MELIQELSDYIEEEINDAIKYVKLAAEIREDFPIVAENIYKISEEEMKHMATLHNQVIVIIDEYRKKNGDPPEAMQMLYDIMHQKHIEHAAKAKAYQLVYKGG